MSTQGDGASDAFVLALTGGVGGAKLCLGLQRVLPAGALRIIVNTGDDFEHLGLTISPDVDTTLYTLAGLANTELGWGRRDETWSFMRVLESLGGPAWFRLGDADLALHVERTRRLAAGETLTDIVAEVARRFGVPSRVLPMSDDPVRTMVGTAAGELAFQEYFVRERCAPAVTQLRYAGADCARIASAAADSLADPRLTAIIIAPSNPYLSIDPALAIPGLRSALRARRAPAIAVTPLIGDAAVKGPTAKIMRELGLTPSALTVCEHYRDLIDGFVLDERDAALAGRLSLPSKLCDTLMHSLEDRERVARCALALAQELRA
ncbi:MAG TPA: 2-phospho-L-lactate transferase [Steroidobacteraceae bacterium]|nr:2-phospho-L-lactate transferase [Steroidobacteraceae bacterium]